MKSYISNFRVKAIVTLALCGLVTVANADDPDKLPEAKSVLKKFADVTGGADKYRAIKSVKMTGKLSSPAQGMEGTIEMNMMVPGKMRVKVEVPDVFTEENGSDGETAWSTNTMMGPRILEGKEKAQLVEEAGFEKVYNPEKFYKAMEVVGMEELDGEKCYKVKLTKQSGLEATEFYSMKTGMQMRTESVVPSQMGEMKMAVNYSDMKEVGGIMFPHKIVREISGMSIVVEFDKIEVNSDVEASVFALPEAVKELVDSKMEEEKK